MREISSDRNGTNIRGLEEKKIETKEEIINQGWKKEEIGSEKLHLGLRRKKDVEEA